MNAPIRRLSTFVALLFATLLVSTTIIQVFPRQGAQCARGQPAHPALDLRPRARADPRRRHPDRGLDAGERRVQVPPHLPLPGRCMPISPVTTLLRRRRAWSPPRTRCSPVPATSSSTAGFRPLHRSQGQGRQPRAHDQRQGPGSGIRRPGDQRARLSRSIPRPARSWPRSASRATTRTRSPRVTWRRSTRHTRRSTATRRALVNRAIAGNLYPPGSTFKVVTAAAIASPAEVPTRRVLPGPANPRPAADNGRSPELRWAHAGRRQGVTDRRPADLVQHRLRLARHGARRGRPRVSRRSSASATSSPCRCGSLRARSRPSSTSRKRPSPPSASTTCASRRCRWPWSRQASPTRGRHEALPRAVGAGLRSDDDRVRRAEHPLGGDQPDVAAELTTMMTSVVASGTGTVTRWTASPWPARPAPPARTRRGAPRLVHLPRRRRTRPSRWLSSSRRAARPATRHPGSHGAPVAKAIMEAVLR